MIAAGGFDDDFAAAFMVRLDRHGNFADHRIDFVGGFPSRLANFAADRFDQFRYGEFQLFGEGIR